MAFQHGLSGLNAAAKNLDVIGNNVANSNTAGFKGSQAIFADVYAASLTGSGGTDIGIGTRLAMVAQQFTQGNITTTNNPLDVAINGSGFFRLSDNGAVTYSRNGQFHMDNQGYIINTNNSRLTGYGVNANGTINAGVLSELKISTSDLSPQPTTELTAVLNLDSRATALTAAGFNLADPTTYNSSTSVSLYDTLGNPHTFSTYYVKTAPDVWEVFAASDGVQIGAAGIGTLTFQPDGQIDTTATTSPFPINAPVTTGAVTPLTFDMIFSGTTQFGSVFSVNALAQDGYTSGRLSGFSVAADGTLQGRYTNGQAATLGQVVLANFANPQGLQPSGNNVWTETADAGAALIGAPNTGSLGVLQSASIEDSNVDLTAELVNMITAQRIYQANAQTIKAQDAVLQTLVNLR